MATRKQRARQHAQRVQHGLAAREHRARALASAPEVVSPRALAKHMEQEGYQQDNRGKWRRALGLL